MTSTSEKRMAAHRGSTKAEPASRSRIAALETLGLRYERLDDFNVIVEGRYQLNIAMSYWRAIDGSAQGYLVAALAAEIKRNSEKPVAGRDSIAPELTFPTILGSDAESATGHLSRLSLLPTVWP